MKNGNLLLVDDEPLILERLKLTLEEVADTIHTALNGVEALKIINKENIHCIVCDINMPKMNGVEVIKRVRADNNDVPFIFYTGHGTQDLMLEAIKYGAFDFLDKPNLDGLEEVIINALREGAKNHSKVATDKNCFVSEYQKLLTTLKK